MTAEVERLMNERGWLTIQQAAQANRVSTRTVRRWIADGLEVVHVDGHAYVPTLASLARGSMVS